MPRPDLTIPDIGRAIREELGCEMVSEDVHDAMDEFSNEHGITIEFLSMLTAFHLAGMKSMAENGTPMEEMLHSVFSNAFLLGWLCGKTFDGETSL